MGSLLRADWLRIRRRWDVWIIVLGIPALALFAYVAGALSAGNSYIQYGGDVPPDFLQHIAAQEAMQRALSALPFQFPRSIATMTQGATMWLILGAAFLAASMLGNEFSWGTIRNVALFRPDRVRYLATRLGWLVGLILLTFGVIVVLGMVAPLILRVDPGDPSALTSGQLNGDQFGGPMGPIGPIGPISLGGALLAAGSIVVVAVAAMGLAGLAALRFRSPATGMLVAGMYVVAEGIAAGLIMSRATGDLRYVPQMALSIRLGALISDVQVAVGLAASGSGPNGSPGWVALPPPVGLAIVAVWLVGLYGLWFVVLRRADIHE